MITHRCSECGHEVDADVPGQYGGSCAFGGNVGHVHRFYPVAQGPSVTWTPSGRRTPCEVVGVGYASCARGTRGCVAQHGGSR